MLFLQEQGKQLFAKSCTANMTLLLQTHDLTDDEGKPDRSWGRHWHQTRLAYKSSDHSLTTSARPLPAQPKVSEVKLYGEAGWSLRDRARLFTGRETWLICHNAIVHLFRRGLVVTETCPWLREGRQISWWCWESNAKLLPGRPCY